MAPQGPYIPRNEVDKEIQGVNVLTRVRDIDDLPTIQDTGFCPLSKAFILLTRFFLCVAHKLGSLCAGMY